MKPHIEAMAKAIQQHENKETDFNKSAQAAYDALMAAGPDLVLEKDKHGDLSAERDALQAEVDGAMVIIEAERSKVVSLRKELADARAAAQAVFAKIWEPNK